MHIAASSSVPTPSSSAAVRCGSLSVKKSTMMLPLCSWHQGRHSEIASAMPNCISSTSPRDRLRHRGPRGDADHRQQRQHAGRAPTGDGEPQRDALEQGMHAPSPISCNESGCEKGAHSGRVVRRLAPSLLVLDQQVARVLQHLLARQAALVHVGDQLVVQRRGGLDPVVELAGRDRVEGVAAVFGGLAAGGLAGVPDLADGCEQRGAGSCRRSPSSGPPAGCRTWPGSSRTRTPRCTAPGATGRSRCGT